MTRFSLQLTIFAASLTFSSASGGDAKLEFFEKNIRPVLVEHCYSCHAATAKNVRGGLLIDSKVGIAAGGESGELLVPGKPEDSLLISALRHESFEMPPDRRLPDHVIKNFEQWIKDGAVDTRTDGKVLARQQIDMAEGRKFWSFQPIAKPTIPTAGTDWAKNDIDHFIAATHQQAELPIAGDATADQIIRRLYFVLSGLPPTPEQILAFQSHWQDNADKAVAAVADELLASTRFGERWGRHWLDVVRFAESSGGGRSLMFPEAWRFREYVIRSFNNDKPIDQLILEHVAGDLLPSQDPVQRDDQLTGSGFLALGPTNYELQDKQLLQMDVIDEQIDTVGRAFLGLTVGCARCHDHKFDPIPTADYYAMAGIFRSTETLVSGNVSGYVKTNLQTGADANAFTVWQKNRTQLEQEIAALGQSVVSSTPVEKFIDASALPGIVVDDDDAIFEGQWTTSTMIAPFVGSGYRHDNFDSTGKRVRFEAQLPDGEYEVRLCHNYADSRCKRLPVSIQHADGTTSVTIDQSKRPEDGVFTSLGTYRFAAEVDAIVSIDAEGSGDGVVIVDALQFLPVQDVPSAESKVARKRKLAELKVLKSELANLLTQKPAVPQVMSVRDSKSPADGHIHVRGAVRNLGAKVPRGFLSVAGEFDSAGHPMVSTISPRSSGRLEMAEWLASPSNPLTSRVFVNRVWQHVIGEGLVRTPDNFGAMGQLPTHPELLDFLAASFADGDQWSVKSLVRRIVCSRTFRMSSQRPEATVASDPDNRLLGRGFRRRLDAEAIRDSLLQIAGQLNFRINGPTIEKITQYDNGYDHAAHSRNMRSVYVPFFRNSMLEIFDVYDIANPNLVTGRRHTSTLPAQALFMLNSPFTQECAAAAANQFLSASDAQKSTSDLVNEVYLLCLGRAPTPQELDLLVSYLDSSAAQPAEVWTSVFQAMFASLDFRFID